MVTRLTYRASVQAALCWLLVSVALSPSAVAQQDQVESVRIREANAREGWQRVPEILVALNAVPGAHVADVGAGDGFFTVHLARAVGPSGRVVAEDINAEALERLRTRVAEAFLTNVTVVQGEVSDPHLAPDTLDAILVVNAYHEMEQFERMLVHFRQALKPRGRLVLVEPLDPRLRGESRARQTKDHSLDAGFADRELRTAGFDVIGLRDPFIRRDATEHWLMVAERGGDTGVVPAAAPRRTPESGSRGALDFGTEAELASPDLRMAAGRLKSLVETERVLVIDVRDSDSYLAGHVPGALLVQLADLADRLPELRAEKKAVVAYCT